MSIEINCKECPKYNRCHGENEHCIEMYKSALATINDILCPDNAPEITLDELREMCKAKREGLYMIPFKVGDRIWRITNDANPHLTRDKIFKIEFRGDGEFVELIGGRIVKLSEIGKTLFDNSITAESALAKEGEKQ